MKKERKFNGKRIVESAVIAALYVLLTLLSSVFGLSSGVIQLRFSEALCILPVFLPAAIPGLVIGCALSDILTGCILWDVLVGSLATLIGALGTYFLRKIPFVSFLPPILANAVLLPFVFLYGYGIEDSYFFFMATVGIGELVSIGLFGTGLYFLIKRNSILIGK